MLIEKGFTIKDIEEYVKTDYTLEELISDKKIQIDSIIKRDMTWELYQSILNK